VGRFPSSISSSSRFVRDVAVALLLVGVAELYLNSALGAFERQHEPAAGVVVAEAASGENFAYLGRSEPLQFGESWCSRAGAGTIVFVGDSQGAGARDHGPGYPEIVAERIRQAGSRELVVSLHVGGANAYEQGLLLMTLLRAGIEPKFVVWSHSIFSQRKNEIRAEYAAAYESVKSDFAAMSASVIPPPEPVTPGTEPGIGKRAAMAATSSWDRIISQSAIVRFMRRSLWDKGEILRRSPAGRLLPKRMRPGAARQFDPPASILRESARFVGEVTKVLQKHGVHVVHIVAPINRAATPRPFTIRSEQACYPALKAVADSTGARFMDLLDAMPPQRYGTYEDGSLDAFHLDGAAHGELAERIMSELFSVATPEGSCQ